MEFFALTSAQFTFETPCTARVMLQACSLQRTATHCNALQHTPKHSNALQHAATHSNTLQHFTSSQRTSTHCNTLQHTRMMGARGEEAVLYCKERSMHCTATHWCYMWHNAPICHTTHSYVTCRSHVRYDAYVIVTLLYLLKTHTRATRQSVMIMTHSQV